jgi:CTP:molybdopterin cytidylyltransferase MocA
MKVLICGSRTVEGQELEHRVRLVLDDLYMSHESAEWEVVAGGARGADSIGARWAEDHQIKCTVVRADWDRHGRSAGFKRNLEMLDLEPDLVVAFVDKPLASSRGTAHTVKTARARSIPTRVFRSS